MRRRDREIKEKNEILQVMKQCDVCRLAFNDGDYPYIIPLNFGMKEEDETIVLYFHGAMKGKKYELMEQNSKASFEMDCDHHLVPDRDKENCTMRYQSVIGKGIISMVPEEKKEEALSAIMEHYHQDDFPINQKLMKMTRVFCLKVKEMTGKENNR